MEPLEVSARGSKFSSSRGSSCVDPSLLLSFPTVVFNIITSIVGVAVFGLPSVARLGGVYCTLAALLVSTFCSYEGAILYHGAMTAWNAVKPHSEHIHSFEDFGFAGLGVPGRVVCCVFNSFWCLGLATAMVVQIGNVLHNITGVAMSQSMVRLWMTPVFLFLCMFPRLKALEQAAPLAVFAAFLTSAAIIVKGALDGGGWREFPDYPPVFEEHQVINMWPVSLPSFGSTVAIAFACYGVMGPIATTVDEMREKERAPRAMLITSVVVCVTYAGIVALGYFAYGNFICDDFVRNMRRYPASISEAFSRSPSDPECGLNFSGGQDDLWFSITAYAVVVNLIFSYPLMMMTVFASCQSFGTVVEKAPIGSFNNYLMRTALVAFTIAVGMSMSSLNDVLGVFGSVSLPMTTCYLPMGVSWIIRNQLGIAHPGKLRLVAHAVIAAFAVFANIFGLMDALSKIFA